ncbi:MAG: dehypoxanthine futalosine cyclase [Bacteroidales bacterium]|nr:dehypoxanthine futalosine cyclase [Bacteroidales bacterium]
MTNKPDFHINLLLEKAMTGEEITREEAVFLYREAPLHLLMSTANLIRKKLHPENTVSWMVDRNVNITNVCVSGCKFCNFFCSKNSDKAYVTDMYEYRQKINELFALGGNQLLLQGGLHPELGLKFYENLFQTLKSEFPQLKLHALSPAEIDFLAKKEEKSHLEILTRLREAGLDSLPGAGAEILSERVRKIVSPNKLSGHEWLEVMRVAHKMNMLTSATMMFGHVETVEERIDHLISIRELQSEKPTGSPGFMSFIPWPFYDVGTTLEKTGLVKKLPTAIGYIRLISIARIVLHNISNIQASWLTVGPETASLCLHSGANDLGSIMIEENVVSAAGASYSSGAEELQEVIRKAGFTPRKRNQDFTDYREERT